MDCSPPAYLILTLRPCPHQRGYFLKMLNVYICLEELRKLHLTICNKCGKLFSMNWHLWIRGLGHWSQQENFDHPGCTMISELLVDNVRLNDVAYQSHHKHQRHGEETDGLHCESCSSCPCFHSSVLNVSLCELYLSSPTPHPALHPNLPALCLPSKLHITCPLLVFIIFVVVTHPPPICSNTRAISLSVACHARSRSVVYSTVICLWVTDQHTDYCTLLPLCAPARANCIFLVRDASVTKFTVNVLTAGRG